MRNLSDPAVAGFVGSIIGGLAALGGALGAVLLAQLFAAKAAKRRADDDLAGAIHIVLSEIAANHAILTRQLESRNNIGPLKLRDSAFEKVELVLAQRLPLDVGEQLFKAYAPIRAGDLQYEVRTWNSPSAGRINEPSWIGVNLEACKDLLPDLEAAAAALRAVRDKVGRRYRPRKGL